MDKDLEVRRRAFERALRPPEPEVTEPGVRVVRGSMSASASLQMQRAAGHPEPDLTSYLWVRMPDAMRTDEPFGVERLVRLHVGERQWLVMGPGDVREAEAANSVATHPLLFPANWVDRLEILARDPVVHAGRQAVRVRARPADRFHIAALPADLPMLPMDTRLFYGSEEFVVVVDFEHGVVLRFEARSDGERMEAIEMIDVEFDVELDPQLFSIQPPPGGFLPPPPQRVSATMPRLAGQVAFVLFIPTWPGEIANRIDRHASYQPADPPRNTQAMVTYSVSLEQEPHGVLWISQSDKRFRGEPDTRWASHPQGLAWVDPDRPNERSKLRLYRDGTHLHLEVSLRPLDWLEQVASSLVPIEPDDAPSDRQTSE